MGAQKTTRKKNLDRKDNAENNFLLLGLRKKWGRKKRKRRNLGSGAHGAIFHAHMVENKQKAGRGRLEKRGNININIYIYIYI